MKYALASLAFLPAIALAQPAPQQPMSPEQMQAVLQSLSAQEQQEHQQLILSAAQHTLDNEQIAQLKAQVEKLTPKPSEATKTEAKKP